MFLSSSQFATSTKPLPLVPSSSFSAPSTSSIPTVSISPAVPVIPAAPATVIPEVPTPTIPDASVVVPVSSSIPIEYYSIHLPPLPSHSTSCNTHPMTTSITILLIYVDDILLTGSDPSLIQALLAQMHAAFSMKELGDVSYFLGISVQALSTGYFLSQHKYAQELLHKAGMVHCKPCSTPIAQESSDVPSSTDVLPYA